MGLFTIPEGCKPVEAITPQAGGAITGDYVSVKNYHVVYVVVHINQAAANTVAITLERATLVDATGSVAISTVVPIWANEDCATSDLLVEQTAAVAFTTSAAQKHKMIIFAVDPATFPATFDCMTVKTGASNAANITSAMYYLQPRYSSRVVNAPSAIID